MSSPHFLHIGKNAGTAVKAACESNRALGSRVLIHDHDTTLSDIPAGEKVFFVVRDPLKRFVSGFYHRKQKLERNIALRRTYNTWDKREVAALEAYADINALLAELFSDNKSLQDKALGHMANIFHIGKYGSYWNWFFSEDYLRRSGEKIFAVLTQENFNSDLSAMSESLGAGPVVVEKSRPTDYEKVTAIDPKYTDRLMSFLRREYRFIQVLKDMGKVPSPYLSAAIETSQKNNFGIEHYSAMKKLRGFQYTENKLLYFSFQKLRRSIGRVVGVVLNKSTLKKRIGAV